jgi:hypothetical protein
MHSFVQKPWIRIVSIAIGIGLLASEASALSRYTSTSLSCGEVQSKIKAEGRVMLGWRADGNDIYRVFILHRRLCRPDEGTELAYVPTTDKKSCPVRRCVDLDLGAQ